MAAGLVQAFAGRLDAHQLDRGVFQEGCEDAHGIGTAADAGDHLVRQATMPGEKLAARLLTDDRLEIADHLRERMRADHRADGVEVVLRILQVFLEGAVHRFLERRRASGDRHQLAAEDLHLGDVGMFLLDVHLAHVDFAGDAHQRAGGGQGDTVLAGAGLGDHLGLAHEPGKQCLAQTVIDFVCPGVIQVLALQVNLRATELLGEAPSMEDRARPAHVVGEQGCQFLLEILALADLFVGQVDVVHRLLEVRRHQLATVGAEVAVGVGHGSETRIGRHGFISAG